MTALSNKVPHSSGCTHCLLARQHSKQVTRRSKLECTCTESQPCSEQLGYQHAMTSQNYLAEHFSKQLWAIKVAIPRFTSAWQLASHQGVMISENL